MAADTVIDVKASSNNIYSLWYEQYAEVILLDESITKGIAKWDI